MKIILSDLEVKSSLGHKNVNKKNTSKEVFFLFSKQSALLAYVFVNRSDAMGERGGVEST
jgi:hypothetical protein